MANTNNKHSSGFFSNAFGVAKKLSSTGISMLNHAAPNSISKIVQPLQSSHVIEGQSKPASAFSSKSYENPQQMLREHLPDVSRQLLGRHYSKVNNVANFISPEFSDRISDYFFEQLNHLSNNLSTVDDLLDEAGIRDLEELTQDVDRSKRLSQALAEQNKWIASLQGAVTGMTGTIGSSIDIPASLVMSLRVIYQVGRSYGFDLSKESDQDIVQYIFRQIDLGIIAEKQALLVALKALSKTIQSSDIAQLQQMLGSSSDAEVLKKFLINEDGQYKWQWMSQIPKVSLLDRLTKLTPLASAGISVVYSRRLVDEANVKAQQVFSTARTYLIQHKDLQLTPLAAYEKSVELLAQVRPKLLESIKSLEHNLADPVLDKTIEVAGNPNITQVKLLKKEDSPQLEVDENVAEEQISEALSALAEKEVEPSHPVPPQKPIFNDAEDVVWQEQQVDAELQASEQVKSTKKSKIKGGE